MDSLTLYLLFCMNWGMVLGLPDRWKSTMVLVAGASEAAFPFIYDRYVENGQGQSLLNTGLFPNSSTALGTQLVSNNIKFDGPVATANNNKTVVPLHLPGSWSAGSSYSHLDEGSYPAGDINSLMTPQIGFSEAIHDPGPVTLGMMDDMGWTVVTDIDDEGADPLVSGFNLYQNYPNPFNPSTSIEYQLAEAGETSLKIYNINGQEIATLVQEYQTPGRYTVQWDGSDKSGQNVVSRSLCVSNSRRKVC